MFFNKKKQLRFFSKQAYELELTTPLVDSTEKPVRKISTCLTKLKESVEDSGENSGQATAVTLEDSLPRFGPLLPVEQLSVQAIKEKAWEHILKQSSQKDQETTKEIYMKAMRKVEKEARQAYADKISGIGSNFRWMMIKDGCFFLQLSLLILGCSEQVGYPSSDPIFGKKQNKKDIKKWIEAMFFIGNQIPFVVLKELLNQKYFQDAIAKAKWDPAPVGLCKRVLYELLILPAVKKNLLKQGNKQQPCDLLHGLHIMVIGDDDDDDPSRHDPDDDIDLEANEEETDDNEASINIAIDDNEESSPQNNNIDKIRQFLNAIGFSNAAIDDHKRIFPCATELKRAGISIKKVQGGVKSIDFKSYYLWACLHLPALPVDDNAEMIFLNLQNYEMNQQEGKQKGEVSSYLKFMSDIIRTSKDVKVLVDKGVIQGDFDDAEKLPRILTKLSSNDIRMTQDFHLLKRKIRDYSSPWIHYKGVVNLVVFLTLLQTLFSILAYFNPTKP